MFASWLSDVTGRLGRAKMLDVEDVVEVFLRIAETNVLVERDRTGRLLRMRVPLGLSLPSGA